MLFLLSLLVLPNTALWQTSRLRNEHKPPIYESGSHTTILYKFVGIYEYPVIVKLSSFKLAISSLFFWYTNSYDKLWVFETRVRNYILNLL